MSSQVERIAAMEVRLKTLEEKVDGMDRKLDALLALRNKGAGVLWLLSGIGFAAVELFHYFWSGK